MIHRHLDYPAATPLSALGRAAIDDVLENGGLEEWAPLAEAIAADPAGALATTVLDLCEAHPMYGTSSLWQDWITRLRRQAAPRPTSLAGLRLRRGLRQADVAAQMGASQPDVSKIESRHDLRVSTLRAYVAATGGLLECRAVYGEESVDLSLGATERH